MNIILVSMNHESAPMELREKLELTIQEESMLLSEIYKIPEIRETLYLSTCNQVEVLAHVKDIQAAVESIKDFILSHVNLTPSELERCLYVGCEEVAVRHFFRVVSGIDSLVKGNLQIVRQVMNAFPQCAENHASGIILKRLLQHAFHVTKQLRTETSILTNNIPVSSAVVEFAKIIFGNLKGKTTLLIGTGALSGLVVRHLIGQGIQRIIIADRKYINAVRLAQMLQGISIGIESLSKRLKESDIVISSTDEPGYVITREMAVAALRRRKNRPIFMVDLAASRNIDPTLAEKDNIFLFNIDDLWQLAGENLKDQLREARKVEDLISVPFGDG